MKHTLTMGTPFDGHIILSPPPEITTKREVWKKIKKLMEKNTDEELGTMDYDGFAKDVIDAMKGEV